MLSLGEERISHRSPENMDIFESMILVRISKFSPNTTETMSVGPGVLFSKTSHRRENKQSLFCGTGHSVFVADTAKKETPLSNKIDSITSKELRFRKPRKHKPSFQSTSLSIALQIYVTTGTSFEFRVDIT